MFGLGKKIEIKKIDINEAYKLYLSNPEKYVFICADEQKEFDDAHIAGAECLPLRLMDNVEEYYPDKTLTYFVYAAVNKAISERAYKKIVKKGYDVYDAEIFVIYRGPEDGRKVSKRDKKRKI